MTHSSPSGAQALDALGFRPVINACGIYTDLGGSRLSSLVWEAMSAANASFASLPDLLDRSGEVLAATIGVPAARVVPGASAGIALAIAACLTRGDGARMEALPEVIGVPDAVVLQRAHRYKYARCVTPAGGRIVEVGDERGTAESELTEALRGGATAILHPAHLDGVGTSLPLDAVVAIAHRHDVPVVVDAAYMSFPTDLFGAYTRRGADLTVFSAKYYWGPNAGGFVCGDADLVDAVRAVDFTGYESGRFLTFGRIFKHDRATVVATVVAAQEWLAIDHEARLRGYEERANAIVAAIGASVDAAPRSFTLDERIVDEPVNCVVLTLATTDAASALEATLAGAPTPVLCIPDGNQVVVCLETVDAADDAVIVNSIITTMEAKDE